MNRTLKLKAIRRSHRAEKKFDAVFEKYGKCGRSQPTKNALRPDGERLCGREKIVSFGAAGMSNYTKHKNATRKQRYIRRHSGMGENWAQPDTPGALSRWILWNKPSFRDSVADYKRRFNL